MALSLILTLSASAATKTPRNFPLGVKDVYISKQKDIKSDELKKIAPLIQASIKEGYYPGAVILVGHQDKIIYKGVFGNRRIVPNVAPMRFNTIFDVASLTKPVVTTTAVMQLIEEGKLNLHAPVVLYWPEFGAEGKSGVTILELLTHTSGLRADLHSPEFKQIIASDLPVSIKATYSKTAALKQIEQLKLQQPPGTKFIYSDVNFFVLGHLVELVSGERLDQYAQTHIFKPLGMKHTFFLPNTSLLDRIAPTQILKEKLRWGEVHDATVNLLGGVTGIAGLFSTAHDLGIFAQCLLDKDCLIEVDQEGKKIKRPLLSPVTIEKMTSPHTPAVMKEVYGLGWDLASPYSTRGKLSSNASFGHTGFTGVSMLIDPATQTWLIILTSRTHPKPASKNKLVQDRRAIADMVAASVQK